MRQVTTLRSLMTVTLVAVLLTVLTYSDVEAQDAAGSGAGAAVVGTEEIKRENYRIGPGDVLDIRVLGEEQMGTGTGGIRVSEDGFIRVPFIDEIKAQCLTERELGAAIAERLKKYLKYPEVFVGVREYNSKPVTIIGAVNAPGRVQVQRRVRLLELIAFAGGAKEDAGRYVHVIHAARESTCDVPVPGTAREDQNLDADVINLSKLMQGDVSQDRIMRPGDIVIVPAADLVFVSGEVLKPNAYSLREGMTLSQVLALAGGPSGIAKRTAIRILRQEPGKPKFEIAVNLEAIQKNKAEDPVLFANDLIEVPDSTGKKITRGFLSAIGAGASQMPLRVIP